MITELSRELHTEVSVLRCLSYEHDLGAANNVTAVTGKVPALYGNGVSIWWKVTSPVQR